MSKLTVKIDKRKLNPIYKHYGLKNKCYLQIYYGGSSSGKSYFLAQRTIIDVMKGRNYLIVRKVQNEIKRSVFMEVKKAINRMGLSKIFKINNSSMTIINKINDRGIYFSGLDDVEKLKGITPKKGVITDIWVEEGTEVTEKDYRQLKKRLRGKDPDIDNKRLTFSFNPIYKEHWIYEKLFIGIYSDDKQFNYGYVDGMKCTILKTTYKDNKHLTEEDIRSLESEPDSYYYNVYTLGNWGVLGHTIFNNWKVKDLSDIKSMFDNVHNGVDWGYADDPFTLVRFHVDNKRNKIYIFDELYLFGHDNKQSSEKVKEKINKRDYVVCDSAEPKSINDFKKYGIHAVPAKKGPGSVEYGIKKLKEYEIIIDKSCKNTQKEFKLYKWQEDKDGNKLPKPVDKNNHIIDALRYGMERANGNKISFA